MSVSSDLIPVNSSSEVAAIAVKAGKKEVVSANAVASWLESAASGKELLSSVLPSTVKKRYSGANIVGWTDVKEVVVFSSIFGVLFSFFGAGVGGVLNSHHIAVGEPASVSTVVWPILVTAVTGGFSFYVPTRIKVSKCQALWNKLMPIQSDGTRKWLQERYGVAVSDEVLTVLASNVLTNQDSTPFADVEGQLWVLRKNSAGLYQVEPQQVDVKASEAPDGIRQAPVVLSVGAAHLDGELGQLGEKIDTRLAQLQKFALTMEESHVVSRTVGDARDAVAAFERLQLLGAEESGTTYLLDVLRLLDSELESIVQVKVSQETELLRAGKQKAIARQSEVGV
jgi:hypothetical protein